MYFKPLAQSVLIPLGLTGAASVADTGIHKKYSLVRNDYINNFKQKNE